MCVCVCDMLVCSLRLLLALLIDECKKMKTLVDSNVAALQR